MIDARTFRDVMAQWPSGVTVVTTLDGEGQPHGMTASSFSSVSLDPPLVSICLTKTLYSHELIANSGVFGVSVLAKDQADVGRRFAGMEAGVEDRFAGESWTIAETGSPVLDSSLGWFDCRIVHAYPGGDHTIFVGEVVAGRAAGRSAPLLFHSRGWGQFADVLPPAATLSDSTIASAETAAQVAATGVRVRVRADEHSIPTNSSALVGTRAEADAALNAGVAVVEIEVDPTDAAQLDARIAEFADVAASTVVHLTDAFAPDAFNDVLAAVATLSTAAVAEIGLADSCGRATPLQVRRLLQEVVSLARPVPIRLRLHDRDRLGLVKALTALKSGVSRFDAALAGVDGAVALGDLVRLLEEMEVEVAIDIASLHALSDSPLVTSSDVTDPVGAVG